MKQPPHSSLKAFFGNEKKRMQTYLTSARGELALALQKARSLGQAAQGVLARPVTTLEKRDSSKRI